MEARHLLKQLKDDGWYLGDTAGPCRQYVHADQAGVITVCVRYTDQLGPDSLASVRTPAAPGAAPAAPAVRLEETPTGFSAYATDLSGCAATGETEAATRTRMSDALALHIAGIRGS